MRARRARSPSFDAQRVAIDDVDGHRFVQASLGNAAAVDILVYGAPSQLASISATTCRASPVS